MEESKEGGKQNKTTPKVIIPKRSVQRKIDDNVCEQNRQRDWTSIATETTSYKYRDRRHLGSTHQPKQNDAMERKRGYLKNKIIITHAAANQYVTDAKKWHGKMGGRGRRGGRE